MNSLTCLLVLASITAPAFAAYETWNGTTVYVAYPPKYHSPKRPTDRNPNVILFLTDIGGLVPPSEVLVDKYAKEGNYIVVAPDLFYGEKLVIPPPGTPFPGYPDGWKDRHSPVYTEPIIDATLVEIRRRFSPSKIGATGYCFGGRYVFRLLGDGKVDVGVSAHPSSTTIEEITAAAVAGRPIQLALAGDDYAFPPEIMDETEAILRNTTTNWTSNVFGGVGVGHGFAVRPGALGNDYHIYVIQKAAEDGISWFKAFL